MYKYKKMNDENEEENNNNECVICFEECKQIEYICLNCNNVFHKKCYKNWINRCKKKGINYKKCVYCQKTGYVHKTQNFCCFKIRVHI